MIHLFLEKLWRLNLNEYITRWRSLMILLKTKLGQHVSTVLGPGNQPLYDALADLPVEKQKINKLINFWCYRSLQTWEHLDKQNREIYCRYFLRLKSHVS